MEFVWTWFSLDRANSLNKNHYPPFHTAIESRPALDRLFSETTVMFQSYLLGIPCASQFPRVGWSSIPFPKQKGSDYVHFDRPPEIESLRRKGRLLPRIDAEQIVQFTQRCRIQFATTATGPQVPWTILYFDFCGMFPESSFAGQKYPTLHCAICAFRALFTRALKVSGLNAILSPSFP